MTAAPAPPEAGSLWNRLLTLAVLLGIGLLLRRLDAPGPPGALAATLLGFTLLSAYVAGALTADAGLPRITGYVLVGLLIGPDALAVLRPPTVASFRTIDEIALTLIALTAGGELRTAELRRELRSIGGLSLGILVVVTLGITGLVLLAHPLSPFLDAQPVAVVIAIAVLLGIWCANSSPDATIAVINESRAQGRFTETIVGVTIFKDILVIVGFAIAIALLHPFVDPAASFDAALVGQIAWQVIGALGIGGIAGLGFALYLQHIGIRNVLATLVFAFVLTIVAERLELELLLAGVAAGFAIENFSKAGDEMIHAVERNARAIFALFFAIAGATLDLDALAQFWPLALLIVAARGVLTWVGALAGSRLGATPAEISGVAWMGLISQAGVTLGLSLLVGREFPGFGSRFVTVTAAVIIVHLLVGPVLLKLALKRVGEIGAGEAILDRQPARVS